MTPLHSLEELDRLALCEPHDRLLPLRLVSHALAHPPRLARLPHGVDVLRLHREQRLDGTANLVLARVRVDRKGHEVLRLAPDRALLRHERLADHVVKVHAFPPSATAAESRAWTCSRAARVKSRWEWRSTSWTFRPSARITDTRARFLVERSTTALGSASTTNTLASPRPSPFRISTTCLVLI